MFYIFYLFYLFPPIKHFSIYYASKWITSPCLPTSNCIQMLRHYSASKDVVFTTLNYKIPTEGTKTGWWWEGERGRRDCCAEKLCYVRPHIFLICLVWNSSFSDSGFVTFSEGTRNIWTPYGSHLLRAKWSYILFSKPFISPSVATDEVLNISTMVYNVTSESLSLLTQIPWRFKLWLG